MRSNIISIGNYIAQACKLFSKKQWLKQETSVFSKDRDASNDHPSNGKRRTEPLRRFKILWTLLKLQVRRLEKTKACIISQLLDFPYATNNTKNLQNPSFCLHSAQTRSLCSTNNKYKIVSAKKEYRLKKGNKELYTYTQIITFYCKYFCTFFLVIFVSAHPNFLFTPCNNQGGFEVTNMLYFRSTLAITTANTPTKKDQ